MKKLLRTVMLMVVCFSFLFAHASAEQSISVGYGFGLLNQDGKSKQLEGGKTYDFIQALYSYERPVTQRFSVLVEPFVAFVNRPTDGWTRAFTPAAATTLSTAAPRASTSPSAVAWPILP